MHDSFVNFDLDLSSRPILISLQVMQFGTGFYDSKMDNNSSLIHECSMGPRIKAFQ